MKLSILIAVLCLGVGCVQAGLFKNEGNHVQRMLSRAGRSFGKRGHDEGGSCKQECDDYGLLAYVHGTLANLLIDCKTLEIYLNSAESEDEAAKRYNIASFLFVPLGCGVLKSEADAEMERYQEPDYKPEVYTCAEYEYFLLVMSCMGTYNTLADFYFATELHKYDHSKSEDELIWYLEQDMLHQCNDLFFGPFCLTMWLADDEDKHMCHELDKLFNFGDYYEEAQEFLCNGAIITGDNEVVVDGQVVATIPPITSEEGEAEEAQAGDATGGAQGGGEGGEEGDAGSDSESSEGGRRTVAERFEELKDKVKAKIGKKASQKNARGSPFTARSKMDARKKNLEELDSLLGKLLQRRK